MLMLPIFLPLSPRWSTKKPIGIVGNLENSARSGTNHKSRARFFSSSGHGTFLKTHPAEDDPISWASERRDEYLRTSFWLVSGSLSCSESVTERIIKSAECIIFFFNHSGARIKKTNPFNNIFHFTAKTPGVPAYRTANGSRNSNSPFKSRKFLVERTPDGNGIWHSRFNNKTGAVALDTTEKHTYYNSTVSGIRNQNV